MTTYMLVHGAWHGPWAWDRVVPLLDAAGARTLTPELDAAADRGLHDHAEAVVAAIDTVQDELVLVGHSYAGLVVREAADARPDAVDRVVLVDGWAGPDGAGMLNLAPEAFATFVRTAAETFEDGRRVPSPPPAMFGITGDGDAAWLAPRLQPQPLRSFTEVTRLTGAVDRIPGTGICCNPSPFPFDRFAKDVGYRTVTLDGPHDVMLTDPEPLARLLLQEREARSLE
ncbi:alpha/beta fold hydrolase [Actinomadura darangshiensis]|uniref:Alpha/beta fold hydrolase n=1 Tax=Actinomadura darangshiensis TaxID=705336 RepID=A0A4R5AZY8_9ACTN|nr:alpha/beta fold hydrolase [Actinomadura darangshiensis]TDD79208.1 alpha/beta fold hydrolase [Actinomadura darangshiensis]